MSGESNSMLCRDYNLLDTTRAVCNYCFHPLLQHQLSQVFLRWVYCNIIVQSWHFTATPVLYKERDNTKATTFLSNKTPKSFFERQARLCDNIGACAKVTRVFSLTSRNLQVLIHSVGSHCQRNLVHLQYSLVHDFHARQRTHQWSYGENANHVRILKTLAFYPRGIYRHWLLPQLLVKIKAMCTNKSLKYNIIILLYII